MTGSKYIEMQSMPTQDFARSQIGAIAKFLLDSSDTDLARFEVAKAIKSACSKAGSICTMATTELIMQGVADKKTWSSSKMITATIIKAGASKNDK